jgi:caa(3)-type oxidase subunit IV
MSETSAAASADHVGPSHASTYIKIWGLLVGLLVLSVVGPMLGIRVVTLITAFGIAVVKAYIVARYFMHINLERKFVTYLVAVMLAFMLVMVAGISPDVLKHDGARWENVAAKRAVAKGEAEGTSEHGGEHAPEHEAVPAHEAH